MLKEEEEEEKSNSEKNYDLYKRGKKIRVERGEGGEERWRKKKKKVEP